ncbi:MAG: hypothetical protein KDA61_14570 [Planctomycetales bacterium]|nr:hypothetical protein [Planctomycetales bacterium]
MNPDPNDERRSAQHVVVYAIDAVDRLCRVDEEWTRFADLNEGGERLKPETVLGESIWTYLRGESLRSLYRDLFAAARRSRDAIRFDFRCDSPAFRRYMQMELQSGPAGEIRFASTTLRTEKREAPLAVQTAVTGHRHLIRCSVCNLFKLRDGTWREGSSIVAEDRALNDEKPLRIVWGVCPNCRQRLHVCSERHGPTTS